MKLNFDNRFSQKLPADPDTENSRRHVNEAAYSFVVPRVPSSPKVLHVADEVAELIGLTQADIKSDEFVKVFGGAKVPDGSLPYAMCYGGHQFGHWAGQLGDGRAINLGEVTHDNRHWMLQLKGAGPTPYSRTADGLAVLRSSLREHLCSEAMYHLGVPTTRSLSLITTGDEVMRDMMYDGNAALETGAVVCRVASSFIRFGNFQIFASRGDAENLKKLVNFTIQHYYPEFTEDKTGYVGFFRAVALRTLEMVIHWQRVGFVHGVMNTDNMSIHGDTIDYGPYGWLEGYDHNWTPNTTDSQNHRYRYGHQPQIALWNLLQLANALYVLVGDEKPLEEILKEYQSEFEIRYNQMMGSKIGLSSITPDDYELIARLEQTLQLSETDMTIFFRSLSKVKPDSLVDDGSAFLDPVLEAFYAPEELTGEILQQWQEWFNLYKSRMQTIDESNETRATGMNAVNPKYVLRNYMAQLAIDKAEAGDASLIDELYMMLKRPYEEQPENKAWFAKRPEWARHKVGCSMLSCSS